MLNSSTCLTFSEPTVLVAAATPYVKDDNAIASAVPANTNLFALR